MATAKKKTRIDPPTRPVDGVAPFFAVRNQDPSRKYVFVPKSATEHGVDHYTYLGYEVETYQESGPFLAMGKKPAVGTEIESRGQILMSIPLERWEQLQEYGADGTSGQNAADEQQKRMLNSGKAVTDTMRGLDFRTRSGARGIYLNAEEGSFMAPVMGDTADG